MLLLWRLLIYQLWGCDMRFRTATLNGVRIAYTDDTEFLIQSGKGRYVTRYTIKGDLGEALFYYKCINVGKGYKKRLLAPSFNEPLLARTIS